MMAIVELSEGPWLETQLMEADTSHLRIGDKVGIAFVKLDGSEALPVAYLVADKAHES